MSDAAEPGTEAEACAVVAEAIGSRTPIDLRGQGTKAGIGRPAQAGRTLSAARLTGITLYEPAELVIAARAGTPLAVIEAELAGRGQALTFEPPDWRGLLGSAGDQTIGGVTAGNLSGPRRIAAGAARDNLIGVRFVNGRGEAIKSGGRVMKNVTGLDLARLLAGSWGTLGFLTEVTFKVLPRAERTTTLILHGLDGAAASAAMSQALSSPYEVTGAAYLPGAAGEAGRTCLRLEGFSFSVDYRAGELRRLFRGRESEIVDGEAASSLWRDVRDVAALGPGDDAVWRISTAPTKGHDVAEAIARLLPARWFSDWGGGLVWLACPAVGDAGAAIVREAIRPFGGHATLIRAPAALRAATDVFQPQAEPLRLLSARVKTALDPHGLFSPGRMHPGA